MISVVQGLLEGIQRLDIAVKGFSECLLASDLPSARRGLQVIQEIAVDLDLNIQTLENWRDQEQE